MEDKSAFDILVENLIELRLTPETHKNQHSFIIPGSDRLLNIKYVVAPVNSMFFLAYDSYGTKVYTSSTFTGLYSTIKLPSEFECKIYMKDWVDFFLLLRKRKIGIKHIDDSITITSKSSIIPSGLLSTDNVDSFLQITNTKPFQLLIQNDYLQMISGLKNQKIIGLEVKDWIYQKTDLERLIDIGGDLLKDITNRQNRMK